MRTPEGLMLSTPADYQAREAEIADILPCTDVALFWEPETVTYTDGGCDFRDGFSQNDMCMIQVHAAVVDMYCETAPGVREYFRGTAPEGVGPNSIVSVTVPTIQGIHSMRRGIIDHLGYAVDFTLVSGGELPSQDYLFYPANYGAFPLGNDHSIYLHDAGDHALGAFMIPEYSWERFRLLAADALAVMVDQPSDAPHQAIPLYREVVAAGLDEYTESLYYPLGRTDMLTNRQSLLQVVTTELERNLRARGYGKRSNVARWLTGRVMDCIETTGENVLKTDANADSDRLADYRALMTGKR